MVNPTVASEVAYTPVHFALFGENTTREILLPVAVSTDLPMYEAPLGGRNGVFPINEVGERTGHTSFPVLALARNTPLKSCRKLITEEVNLRSLLERVVAGSAGRPACKRLAPLIKPQDNLMLAYRAGEVVHMASVIGIAATTYQPETVEPHGVQWSLRPVFLHAGKGVLPPLGVSFLPFAYQQRRDK